MSESKYAKINLNRELAEKIEQFMNEYPEHGYRTLGQFVEDAVRRRAEELRVDQLTPRFTHFNTYEDHVTIMDKKLGWDDKEGRRQPRIIDVFVRPVGEFNDFKFWCSYCNSDKCEHVKYVLSIWDKTVRPLEERGANYVGPTFEE